MSRNQVSIYILSFLIVFITTTFSTYSLGSYPARLPKSPKEKEAAQSLHEQIHQNNFDAFVRMLDNYPQYINTAYYYQTYDDYLTPLQSAALLGRDDFIDELLKRKIDLFPRTKNKGNSILHLSNIPRITQRFIDLTFKLEARNSQFMTPLLLQTYKKVLNRGVIRTLLEAGANPDARTNISELTALHILFKPHHAHSHREDLLAILGDLLEYGASVDATTKQGATALHFAAGNNDVQAIQMLVDKAKQIGIKGFIDAQNLYGDTPLSTAYKHQSREAITELLKLGANPFVKNNFLVSVNGDAHTQSFRGSGETLDFSKFVLDEVAKYFNPSPHCARSLMPVNS